MESSWASRGLLAGRAFAAQSVLYLLDVTLAVAPQTVYRVTERGLQQDLTDYHVSYQQRMHDLWWGVAVRDVLGPLGHLALIVLVVALLHVAGTGKPRH